MENVVSGGPRFTYKAVRGDGILVIINCCTYDKFVDKLNKTQFDTLNQLIQQYSSDGIDGDILDGMYCNDNFDYIKTLVSFLDSLSKPLFLGFVYDIFHNAPPKIVEKLLKCIPDIVNYSDLCDVLNELYTTGNFNYIKILLSSLKAANKIIFVGFVHNIPKYAPLHLVKDILEYIMEITGLEDHSIDETEDYINDLIGEYAHFEEILTKYKNYVLALETGG